MNKLLERAKSRQIGSDQLLLHQLLVRLPENVGQQLRATGETKALGATIAQARLLMSIDYHEQSAAITNISNEIHLLQEHVARLTEQITSISMPAFQPRASDTQHHWTRCFNCNRKGHMQRACPLCNRESDFC